VNGVSALPKGRRARRSFGHLPHPLRHHIRSLRAGVGKLVPGLQLSPGARVLDYGCGAAPYRDLLGSTVDYVAADFPHNRQATLELNDDGSVPAPDGAFDAVLSTQVLEHVRSPAAYLAECRRMLRPGGRLLLTTHGVFYYHPDPVDLWRWTSEGLRRAVEAEGLRIERFEGIVGLAATGLQLLQDGLSFRAGPRLTPWIGLVGQPLVALADRFETPESRRLNAQVFGLVAVRP
jgi:SAM-dependent methyltransferase